jgi:hypothetical protein
MHATNVIHAIRETCGTPVNLAKATGADKVPSARRPTKPSRPSRSHRLSPVAIPSSNTAVAVGGAVEEADIHNMARAAKAA